jgi:hypothetical protein
MWNQNTGNIILVGCLQIEDLENRYSGNECVCIWCEILVILPELYDRKNVQTWIYNFLENIASYLPGVIFKKLCQNNCILLI